MKLRHPADTEPALHGRITFLENFHVAETPIDDPGQALASAQTAAPKEVFKISGAMQGTAPSSASRTSRAIYGKGSGIMLMVAARKTCASPVQPRRHRVAGNPTEFQKCFSVPVYSETVFQQISALKVAGFEIGMQTTAVISISSRLAPANWNPSSCT